MKLYINLISTSFSIYKSKLCLKSLILNFRVNSYCLLIPLLTKLLVFDVASKFFRIYYIIPLYFLFFYFPCQNPQIDNNKQNSNIFQIQN